MEVTGTPAAGPLAGITVLDVTSYVSGPFCTMLLGDLGATVLKIENPARGDGTRKWGPGTTGPDNAYYMSVNRNKQSVAVDLKLPEGQEIVRALIAGADAFVHNLLDNSARGLGIDEDSVRRANPTITYCVVRGFPPGQERPVFDFVMQAVTGLMGITGEPDRPPVKVPFPVLDIVAAYNACIGVLASLVDRAGNGAAGRSVDVNMLEASLASMPNLVANYLVDGTVPQRSGNVHGNIAPYELFETADGWIAIGAGTERQWQRLCTVLGAEHLREDPRYRGNPARVSNRAALHKELADILETRRRDEWVALLESAEVPVSPVRGFDDVVDELALPVPVRHPTRGEIRLARNPLLLDSTRPPIRHVPPVLGEHTEDVLRERLGLDADRLADLERRRVIRTAAGWPGDGEMPHG
ncbi:CaiB/BaiF CoA transferase family protein [Actinophytocola sp.]|uniref:CaiB/BaiF CoA transferase family protein n=1 Tax=Actinophytocola sp. TaxID=1872138 RepID=UPI003D6AFAE7